jgi:hypothetical protein
MRLFWVMRHPYSQKRFVAASRDFGSDMHRSDLVP